MAVKASVVPGDSEIVVCEGLFTLGHLVVGGIGLSMGGDKAQVSKLDLLV